MFDLLALLLRKQTGAGLIALESPKLALLGGIDLSAIFE